MINLHIDTSGSRIRCQLELAGETAPIDIELVYRIDGHASAQVLHIEDFHCSRVWINRLLQDFVPADKRVIPLPDHADTILQILKIQPEAAGSSS